MNANLLKLIKYVSQSQYVATVTDNGKAIELIREIQPEWIDELPMLSLGEGKVASIPFRFKWDEQFQVALYVEYNASGKVPSESTWTVSLFPCDSLETLARYEVQYLLCNHPDFASLKSLLKIDGERSQG